MSRAALLALGTLLFPLASRPQPAAAHLRAPVPVVLADTVTYAGTQRWFVDGEAVRFGGRRWVKFGLTQPLTQTEAVRVGEYRGVPVYRTHDKSAPTDVLYLPVTAGCEFQPFRMMEDVARVRG
jgi:hypothetical protein